MKLLLPHFPLAAVYKALSVCLFQIGASSPDGRPARVLPQACRGRQKTKGVIRSQIPSVHLSAFISLSTHWPKSCAVRCSEGLPRNVCKSLQDKTIPQSKVTQIVSSQAPPSLGQRGWCNLTNMPEQTPWQGCWHNKVQLIFKVGATWTVDWN